MSFLPVLEGQLVVGDLGTRSTSSQCVNAPTNEMVPGQWRWWYPIWRGGCFEVLSAFEILKHAVFQLIAYTSKSPNLRISFQLMDACLLIA